MEKRYDYRIGLDIGITSVGWAVLRNNSKDEPDHIIDLGVRIFDRAENPKNGEALAGPRRDARSARRRLRRRRHRLERIKWLLEDEKLIDIENFMERYYKSNLPNVYQLRYEALDRKLKDDEFAQILLHIAKHRGFKSNRKAETLDEKNNGAVLTATKANQALLADKGYRTVGEMMYCDISFKTQCPWDEEQYTITTRNKAEDYKHTVLRAMLVDEVHAIFQSQRELGNVKATEQLEEKYLSIMESQRSFDLGPGPQANGNPSPYALEGFEDRVGKCTFEKDEKRAAKACYTAELFVALQKINHIRLVLQNGEARLFTEEEREKVIDLLHNKKEISYKDIRKRLGIDMEYRFNSLNYKSAKADESLEEIYKETEKAKCVSLSWYHEYMKRIGATVNSLPLEGQISLLDNIGTILTLYKNDDSRSKRLMELKLSQEDINQLLELSPSKFQHLSLKAMGKIIPYLEEGLTYDKACDKAGYNFKAEKEGEKSVLLKGDIVNEVLNDIANPVVKRSISQTIKVINAIILKYGSPQAIHVELAREMSKNFDDRRKIEKQMNERAADNENVKKQIQELGTLSPTGQDILKYRLWQDQQGICMYSGKKIPLEQLFKSGYDIDHILPYSITFDDSYRNKVLVTSEENRQKGNRTPYEYFGNDAEKWKEFEVRVKSLIRDGKKQNCFFKETITDEDKKQFKERNLTDTKYITTVVFNLILQNLKMSDFNTVGKKKHVVAVNGAITAYLRKRWGLPPKNRDTDTHHAQDAVVIACCTDGMINKISRSMQALELRYLYQGKIVDEETGEIFDRKNYSLEEWKNHFGTQIPRPWIEFKKELEVRMGDDPKGFLDTHQDVACEIDYPEDIYKNIRPIFVSRMPNHKVTGAAHADTIRSNREYEETGRVITKTDLTSLKLNSEGEIDGYYNPESDRLLYEAIKRQLRHYSNDGKKAFAEPFHKPKADGSVGPIVKKVKISKKLSLAVPVRNGNGVAENGEMVRIDVFKENGKFYFVPVYTADVVKKQLPNKASTAHKPYTEWKTVEDKDFLFSLYSRDLIHVKSKKEDGLKLNMVTGGQVCQQEMIAYYTMADISAGNISGIAPDSRFKFRGLGVQNLMIFEKCQVDILGNISVVKQEKRIGFK